MSHSQEYVVVLWGDQFEEAEATIFITEFRRVGLRVKVVGLSQRRTSGIHGLALVPDLTLEEALLLARNTICVIIPCQSPALKRLQSDPRLRDFFELAQANNAVFVAGPEIVELGLLPTYVAKVIVYPGSEALVEFARETANQISPL